MTFSDEMQSLPFSDGLPARLFTLTNQQGSRISIMDVGATWLSCKIQMRHELREVLLGVNSMEKHRQQQVYLGATVGRYANRINAGKFVINGKTFQTSVNQAGHCLHGGVEGFDKRRWQLVEQSPEKVTLSLLSEDGDQGFPGKLLIYVSYQLNDAHEVCIEYRATVDKTCPVNLTNHAYFNLMGVDENANCLAHHLQINAQHYLPCDKNGIPLGALVKVMGSSFDFRQQKTIQQDFCCDQQQQDQAGYDHSFLLDKPHEAPALTLTAPDHSLQLQLHTDKPAVHLYTGNFLQGCPSRGKKRYANYAGVALETQYLPDSPNHHQWPQPSVYLHPQQPYHFTTRYCFKVK